MDDSRDTSILSLCHIRDVFIRKLNINLGVKIMNRDYLGLPRGLSGKEPACHAGDVGSIPESRRSPEERLAIHSSILAQRVPMDRRAWRAIIRGFAKSWTLSN